MEKCLPKLLSSSSRILITMLLLLMPLLSEAQIGKTLTPDAVVVQYAGSIGYGSIGAGYTVFRKENGSLDLIYGFVPRSKGGSLHSLNTKFAYRPLSIHLAPNVTLYPVNPGVFLSYQLGDEFKARNKEYFEKGYYWWSQALRTHVSFSSEVKVNTQKLLHDKGLKNVRVYSEVNTNDLYFLSWYKNQETMSVTDIFKVGVGLKLFF